MNMKYIKPFYHLSTLSSVIPTVRPSVINKYPLCRDCKFFIANDKECRKFGDIDLVTGKKSYNYARYVRNDENKCGQEAKHFETNNFKMITVPYYLLLDIGPPILAGVSIVFGVVSFSILLAKQF